MREKEKAAPGDCITEDGSGQMSFEGVRIQQERQSGAPILSDPSGYWIAENEAELRRCIKALHARAGEIHRTAQELERLE